EVEVEVKIEVEVEVEAEVEVEVEVEVEAEVEIELNTHHKRAHKLRIRQLRSHLERLQRARAERRRRPAVENRELKINRLSCNGTAGTEIIIFGSFRRGAEAYLKLAINLLLLLILIKCIYLHHIELQFKLAACVVRNELHLNNHFIISC